MKVYIDPQVAQLLLLNDSLLRLKDRRLLMRTWVEVKAIQIVIVGVQTVVASSNTIWVQQRYYLKLVLFQE